MPVDRSRLGLGAGVVLLGAAALLGIGALRPVAAPAPPTTAVSVARHARTNEVVAEGARFAVGRAGDVVVVADWTCSQRPTAAVLRPSTGGLFVFDGWPAAGDPTVPAVRVHAEPGATTLAPDAACGRADLGYADGTHHVVPTTPLPPPLSVTNRRQGAGS